MDIFRFPVGDCRTTFANHYSYSACIGRQIGWCCIVHVKFSFLYQILLFLILTVITTILGWHFYPKFEKIFGGKNQSVLNNPSKRNIGEIGTVVSLEENEGIVLFGGIRWHFRLQKGTPLGKDSIEKVKVVDSEGSILIAKPLANQEDH